MGFRLIFFHLGLVVSDEYFSSILPSINNLLKIVPKSPQKPQKNALIIILLSKQYTETFDKYTSKQKFVFGLFVAS